MYVLSRRGKVGVFFATLYVMGVSLNGLVRPNGAHKKRVAPLSFSTGDLSHWWYATIMGRGKEYQPPGGWTTQGVGLVFSTLRRLMNESDCETPCGPIWRDSLGAQVVVE